MPFRGPQADDPFEERRLAGPVGTDDGDDLARCRIERNAIDDHSPPGAHRQILDDERRHRRSEPPNPKVPSRTKYASRSRIEHGEASAVAAAFVLSGWRWRPQHARRTASLRSPTGPPP